MAQSVLDTKHILHSSVPQTLTIELLGRFRLAYGGAPVTLANSARLQSLLAYLLLHHNVRLSRQQLSFAFWPDSTEAQARNNLRNLLYRLRHDLPGLDRFLHADAQTLEWRADAPYTLDVQAFESAIAQADRAEGPAERQSALESAFQVYRGDLFPSCYDDWVLPERERLHQAYTAALAGLAQLLEETRDYVSAIGYAQRLLRHAPLKESAYRRLMRLHALNDDRASALGAYRNCTESLARELGIEPDAATREMYERLLDVVTPHEQAPVPPVTGDTLYPLVGRQSEWTALRAAWQQAAAGEPRLALIAGESGIGKTRLAKELAHWVTQQGMRTAVARCYAAEGELAYAPVVDWLRAHPLPELDTVWYGELSRLLPESLAEHPDLSPPPPMTEAWQRRRLFEALARAILGSGQPLLLVLDDIQWCDQETIEWLHYLLRFDSSARLLVVATLRSEEVLDKPLVSCLRALGRGDRLTRIELGPLSRAETARLAALSAHDKPSAELADCLYWETEGNPLYVVELARAGFPVADGDWTTSKHEPACPPHDLPPKVQEAIEARLARLSPPARDALGLAATIGRRFAYNVLERATGDDPVKLVQAVEELVAQRIVQEQTPDVYDFTHDKLREVAYASQSTPRRRMLHHRVAQALVAVYAQDPGAYPEGTAIRFASFSSWTS